MKITALAGGVGGAKLAHGFSSICMQEEFSVIVNTADDFTLYGLYICPDLDTVMYTLANIADPETGWGIRDDTFQTLMALERYGGPTWFRLGDQDIAIHMERTRRLFADHETLTDITLDFCRKLGVESRILPMCNEKVSTMIGTNELGLIPFQEYFVKHHFSLSTSGINFHGIENATLTDEVINSIETSDLIVICPSNPFVSINPILSIYGLKSLLAKKKVIAVSPIIAEKAVKGPLAQMMIDMGYPVNPGSIALIYKDIIDYLIIDQQDSKYQAEIEQSGIIPLITDIYLPDLKRRKMLAEFIMRYFNKVRID